MPINDKLYVLDTSVLVHDPEALRNFRETSVAIPIFVVMELDDLKVSPRYEVASSARQASRRISDIVALGDVNSPKGIEDPKTKSIFYMVGQETHFESIENTTLSRKMDLLILGAALVLQDRFVNKKVILVTKDVNLRILATAKGLHAEDYRKDRVDANEVPTGVHEVTLTDPDALQSLYGREPPTTVDGVDLSGVKPNEFVKFSDGQLFRWNGSSLRPLHKTHKVRFEPRNDGQRMALDLLLDPKIQLVILLGMAGSGKAQPLDAKVMTPRGWKVMGEILPGDTVMTPQGETATVQAVFPQGAKDIYRVHFTDGSSTECCKEHLWQTQTVPDRTYGRAGTVKNLEEIMRTLRYGRNSKRNHSIPMTEPVPFAARPLPVDPYLMGCLLGDGSMVGGSPTLSSDDPQLIEECRGILAQMGCTLTHKSGCDYAILGCGKGGPAGMAFSRLDPKTGTKKDYASFQEVEKDGFTTAVYRACDGTSSHHHGYQWRSMDPETQSTHALKDALMGMGLWGKMSHEKHIPNEYMFSSISQRTALLQGLMDTDGTAGKLGGVSFTTTSPHLCEGMKNLVQSLGGTASVGSRQTTYTYKGERRLGRVSYTLHLCLPNGLTPFRLARKQGRVSPRVKYHPRRYIDRVEYVGTKEAQCILIDHPSHLYLTDDYIVTHNTLMALQAGLHQLSSHYDKIILSKPVVPMGRELGFLPGDMGEKMHPWMMPFFDNLDQIIATDKKDNARKGVKERNWEQLVESGQVEIQPMHSIRGRSIPRAFMLFDECFPGKQRIATSEGNKTISWIYNQWRLGRDVPAILSFNETSGQWEHKRVTHAWKRDPRDLMMFRCANQKVRVTPNHRFFGINGWVEAGDLKVGDLLRTTIPARHQIITALNDDQRQVVLGSFLGDGHISKCGINRYRMSEPHGVNQSDYCAWKASMFGVVPTEIPSSYGSTPLTKFSTKVFGWDAEFPEKKSHCPQWVLDAMDARALAVWYMDDGSVVRARGKDCGATLYTCSFDEESHDRMVDTLRRKFNVDCFHRLDNYGDGRTYRAIRLSAEGFRTLRDLIAPYVHPNLYYKLKGATNEILYGTPYNWDHNPPPYGLTVVDEVVPHAGNEHVYDLEVEDNHNFVACSGSKGARNTGPSGILAHNCQNATPHEVKTAVSRAATGTKVVLCGDPSQIDDPFLDALSNGLVHAAKVTRESLLSGVVYLGDGVRSPLADLAAKSM